MNITYAGSLRFTAPLAGDLPIGTDRHEGYDFYRLDGGAFIQGRSLRALIKTAYGLALTEGKLAAHDPRVEAVRYIAERFTVLSERIYFGLSNVESITVSERYFGKDVNRIQVIAVPVGDIEFAIEADPALSEHDWNVIWAVAGEVGLGRLRDDHHGYGKFEITRWERVS